MIHLNLIRSAKIWLHRVLGASLSAILLCALSGKTESLIPVEEAKSYFAQAKALSDADHGKLWGIALYGPLMFVAPEDRGIVANQVDSQGALKSEDGVFTGTLPATQIFANTAFEWSGIRWTQMLWPLPEDAGLRKILIAHEMFHRIQTQLGLPNLKEGDNQHLDTRAGRYYLQLEWSALKHALEAKNKADRTSAISDALLFRVARYRLFPEAAAEEKALELNEGLAEYTGVKLGCSSGADQTQAAIHDLTVHKADPTLIRSFAYATGPAYGLLLDRYAPSWRNEIVKGKTYTSLLAQALKMAPPADIEATAKLKAGSYDGDALWQEETQRDTKRQNLVQEYRARFINGALLILPQHHLSVQFDPRNLQPLEDVGIVYPSLRVIDDWGILEANKGALMKKGKSAVVVEAPTSIAGKSIEGNGWTLELSPQWSVVPAARKGDFTVQRQEPGAPKVPMKP